MGANGLTLGSCLGWQKERLARALDAHPANRPVIEHSEPLRWLLLVLLALVTGAAGLRGQQPLPSLGFEKREPSGQPTGWFAAGEGYSISLDSVTPFAGTYSLRTRWVDGGKWAKSQRKFANISTRFPLASVRGRRLRLSGYIRTERITSGYAGLWIRVDGMARTLALETMQEHGVRQTTPWTRYEIEVPVDSAATGVIIGVLHNGNGSAWFDSLTATVVAPIQRKMLLDAVPR